MKKFLVLLLTLVLVFSLVACSKPAEKKEEKKEPEKKVTEKKDEKKEVKTIEKLVVYFVPSREPDKIITQTEPLKAMLQQELKAFGYDVKTVDIQVGTSYEAAGEALDSGSAHVAFLPGGTYVLYENGSEVILTATRAGLSKDSSNAKDWNDNKPTEATDTQVTYYKGLIVAGPSKKGQELLKKVNAGEKLTKEDLAGAKWGVRGVSSSSGYIYPTIWVKDNFGVAISDFKSVIPTKSYGDSISNLATEQVDLITIYADARRDYAKKWQEEFKRTKPIWEETGVIGVTSNIYNDTISVSKNNKEVDDKLKAALQDVFIKIASTEKGKEVIKIYSHEGYKKAKASDYDKEREAQKILKEIKKK